MPNDAVAERIARAIQTGDIAPLVGVLAPDVTWGPCVGRQSVARWLAPLLDDAELIGLTAHHDRIVVQARRGEQETFQVAFVANEMITELADATDTEDALRRKPTALPARPCGEPTAMTELAAVLPVADVKRALLHYNALGFETSAYDDAEVTECYYGYARRGGVYLHFSRVDDLDPAATTSAVYLHVEDADTLYAEWRTAGVGGQFHKPADTAYRIREGAHVDLDGNLLRFGSPLAPSQQ